VVVLWDRIRSAGRQEQTPITRIRHVWVRRDLHLIRRDRFRLTSGSIDRDMGNDRSLAIGATSRWHPEKSMAILARAVNSRAASGIDPEMETVAILRSRFPAPRQLPLAVDQHMNADPCLAPADPDIGKNGPFAQTPNDGSRLASGSFSPLSDHWQAFFRSVTSNRNRIVGSINIKGSNQNNEILRRLLVRVQSRANFVAFLRPHTSIRDRAAFKSVFHRGSVISAEASMSHLSVVICQ